jgi:hypothetical protein
MIKIITAITLTLTFSIVGVGQNNFGQFLSDNSSNVKLVGAGVIDVLMGTTKVGKNAKSAAALDIVRNVLQQSSRRDHELDVATASKTEIVIREENGNNARVVYDAQGSLYIVLNDQIFPIGQSIIDVASNNISDYSGYSNDLNARRNGNSNNLAVYDLDELGNSYASTSDFGVKGSNLESYYSTRTPSTIYDICTYFDLSKESVGLEIFSFDSETKSFKKESGLIMVEDIVRNGEIEGIDDFWRGDLKAIPSLLGQDIFEFYDSKAAFGSWYVKFVADGAALNPLFTYNWARYIDNNGYSLNEFHGLKRTFYKSESCVLGVDYTSTTPSSNLVIKLWDDYTGVVVLNKHIDLKDHSGFITYDLSIDKLFPGIYTINVQVTNRQNKVFSQRQEKLQILRQQDTKEVELSESSKNSSGSADELLFQLIEKKLITQIDFKVMSKAMAGNSDSFDKSIDILFDLVSSGKIDKGTFSILSKAIKGKE